MAQDSLLGKVFNTDDGPGIVTPYDVHVRALTMRDGTLGTFSSRDWALQLPLGYLDLFRDWAGVMKDWPEARAKAETGDALEAALAHARVKGGGVHLWPLTVLEMRPETASIPSMQPWLLDAASGLA